MAEIWRIRKFVIRKIIKFGKVLKIGKIKVRKQKTGQKASFLVG